MGVLSFVGQAQGKAAPGCITHYLHQTNQSTFKEHKASRACTSPCHWKAFAHPGHAAPNLARRMRGRVVLTPLYQAQCMGVRCCARLPPLPPSSDLVVQLHAFSWRGGRGGLLRPPFAPGGPMQLHLAAHPFVFLWRACGWWSQVCVVWGTSRLGRSGACAVGLLPTFLISTREVLFACVTRVAKGH